MLAFFFGKTYVGIDATTHLIRISSPPCDKNFDVHPLIQSWSRFLTKANILLFAPSKFSRSPKYDSFLPYSRSLGIV